MSDEVAKESVKARLANRWVPVSTAAVQLFPNMFGADNGRTYKGVEIYALSTNGEPVFVAADPNVTADTDAATGGRELLAGGAWFVPIEDITQLYAIAPSGTQQVHGALV